MTNLRGYVIGAGLALAIVVLNLLVIVQIGLAYGRYDWTLVAGKYGSYGPSGIYILLPLIRR